MIRFNGSTNDSDVNTPTDSSSALSRVHPPSWEREARRDRAREDRKDKEVREEEDEV